MTTSRARLSSFQLQSSLSCYFFWLCSVTGTFITNVGDHTTQVRVTCIYKEIEVTSWLVSGDDFSSRVARGANERVSAANE